MSLNSRCSTEGVAEGALVALADVRDDAVGDFPLPWLRPLPLGPAAGGGEGIAAVAAVIGGTPGWDRSCRDSLNTPS